MAVTSQQIIDFLLANPGMSDADIASVMATYGVSPSQVAEATGSNVAAIQERFDAVAPPSAPVYEPAPLYEPTVAPVAPVAPAVAGSVSNEQIIDFLTTNPNLTDDAIVKVMETYKISPSQLATAVGLPESQVAARVAATVPQGSSVTLGDTVIVPQYQTSGSGMDQQIGALESFATSKTTGDVNYKAPVGTPVDVYSASGEFINTVETKKDQSFLGGLVDAFKDPVVLAAIGGAAAGGLLGSGASALGATEAATTGVAGMGAGTGLTAGGAGLGLNAAGTAGIGAGTGAGITAGTGLGAGVLTGSTLGTGLLGTAAGTAGLTGTGILAGSTLGTNLLGTTGTGALTGTGVLTGSGLGTSLLGTGAGTAATVGGLGNTVANLGTGALTTGLESLSTGLTGLGTGVGTGLTGIGTGIGTGLSGLGTGLGTGLSGVGTGLTGIGAGIGTGLSGLGTGLTTGLSGLGSSVGTGLAGLGGSLGTGLAGLGTSLATGLSGLGTGLGTGLTNSAIGNLLSTGLTTSAGLLQQQSAKEAAQKAQAVIDAETAAAKQAAMFRPVGMTTRFGTSEFKVDPVTGQITSAGYTLSPEAKAAQDRFVNLASQGLTQAEQAQQQFAPLQTGAQSLFSLGNQYLAQSPEQVAQNYLNQQMALLQPGRELELANLQNKLQQQGRGGLSVAQGGSYGATTPELQALYNARAMQEAQLAAQAQQAGQQQVTFGANLLGQGAQTMGQYYGGQQAAYSPYTTALGQVQALETAAQQPLQMGVNLGQTAAQAGANVGQLGLKGAGASVDLATGQAATNSPYASLLAGLGASPSFGNAAGGLLTGGLSGLQSMFSQTGLGSSGFGSGLGYGNQDLGLFL